MNVGLIIASGAGIIVGGNYIFDIDVPSAKGEGWQQGEVFPQFGMQTNAEFSSEAEASFRGAIIAIRDWDVGRTQANTRVLSDQRAKPEAWKEVNPFTNRDSVGDAC